MFDIFLHYRLIYVIKRKPFHIYYRLHDETVLLPILMLLLTVSTSKVNGTIPTHMLALDLMRIDSDVEIFHYVIKPFRNKTSN